MKKSMQLFHPAERTWIQRHVGAVRVGQKCLTKICILWPLVLLLEELSPLLAV